MKYKRGWSPATPRFLDERAQSIQLLVIRDAFITILLLALLFTCGIALFRTFVLTNIGLLASVALVSVGVVALVSTLARRGWNWEEKRASARGQLLLAPVEAALIVVLLTGILGEHPSLPDWLIWYAITLGALLLYPLLALFIIGRGQ